MTLQGESTLTKAEKVTEAQRLVGQLADVLERMAPHESKFVMDIADRLESHVFPEVTNKQLFWLRDLAMKY